MSNATESIDAFPKGGSLDIFSGRVDETANAARREDLLKLVESETSAVCSFDTDFRKEELMREISGSRLDAAVGIKSGLMFGSALWVSGLALYWLAGFIS
jgi:hypothetical protein